MIHKTPTTREILSLVILLAVIAAITTGWAFYNKGNLKPDTNASYQSPYKLSDNPNAIFAQIPGVMPKSLILGSNVTITNVKQEQTPDYKKTSTSVSFIAFNDLNNLTSEYEKMLNILSWKLETKQVSPGKVSMLFLREGATLTVNINDLPAAVSVNLVHVR